MLLMIMLPFVHEAIITLVMKGEIFGAKVGLFLSEQSRSFSFPVSSGRRGISLALFLI